MRKSIKIKIGKNTINSQNTQKVKILIEGRLKIRQ